MNKQDIREKVKEILNSMGSKDRQRKDELIYRKIIKKKEYKKAKTIFSYVSMGTEVDTKKILLLSLKEGKEVYVPRVNMDKKVIEIIRLRSWEELRIGVYNILEPKGEAVKKNIIDMILVPGLAFDKNNNRLGRGGGYFDKFLSKVKGLKVGICYQEQIFDEVPAELHDIRMDWVVSG